METMYSMLNVEILHSELLRSTNTFTKMNPYVVFHHSSQGVVLKTDPCMSGNKNPVWNSKLSVVIDDVIQDDMQFKIIVYNKNKYSKDSQIGESDIDITYIKQVGKIEDADYHIFFKNKKVGTIFINMEYFDTMSELNNANGVRLDQPKPITHSHSEPQRIPTEVLNSDYQPDGNQSYVGQHYSEPFNYAPESRRQQEQGENIIAIDASLSPLEANLSINQTSIWFKFETQQSYMFDFDKLEYELIPVGSPYFLNYHFRVTELPDHSFLITGGNQERVYSKKTLHLFDTVFYQKSNMA